jgi:hypothetical protein
METIDELNSEYVRRVFMVEFVKTLEIKKYHQEIADKLLNKIRIIKLKQMDVTNG